MLEIGTTLRKDMERDYAFATGNAATLLRMVEAVLFDPGFRLTFSYRLIHGLVSRRRWKWLGYILWQLQITVTACHINPRSIIYPGVYFPHPTSIVIGEGVVVHEKVTIFQSVTLGKKSVTKNGYPTVMSGVVLYTGAVVVGECTIGAGSIVGANAFVSKDIAEHTSVRPLSVT